MKIVGIRDEDFTNYKKSSMYIGFPHCSFKCGHNLCQNSTLAKQAPVEISCESLVKRYINNSFTDAIVIAGLEPMDDYDDLLQFIIEVRKYCTDDIVIYTGYNKDEILGKVDEIKCSGKVNIIIKFGRFIPDQKPHYDTVLGINLASDNQYAERIC